jgi:hypothetical protein
LPGALGAFSRLPERFYQPDYTLPTLGADFGKPSLITLHGEGYRERLPSVGQV